MQRQMYDLLQEILASPTKKTCKTTWILKRRQEDAEENIRNVRARLEVINNGLLANGLIAYSISISDKLNVF